MSWINLPTVHFYRVYIEFFSQEWIYRHLQKSRIPGYQAAKSTQEWSHRFSRRQGRKKEDLAVLWLDLANAPQACSRSTGEAPCSSCSKNAEVPNPRLGSANPWLHGWPDSYNRVSAWTQMDPDGAGEANWMGQDVIQGKQVPWSWRKAEWQKGSVSPLH